MRALSPDNPTDRFRYEDMPPGRRAAYFFFAGTVRVRFYRKVNALGGRFLLASFHFLPKRIERQVYVEIEFVSRNVAVFHFDLVVASFVPESACAWYPAANSPAKRQIGSFFITGVLAGRFIKLNRFNEISKCFLFSWYRVSAADPTLPGFRFFGSASFEPPEKIAFVYCFSLFYS